jgi:hypothetical protein
MDTESSLPCIAPGAHPCAPVWIRHRRSRTSGAARARRTPWSIPGPWKARVSEHPGVRQNPLIVICRYAVARRVLQMSRSMSLFAGFRRMVRDRGDRARTCVLRFWRSQLCQSGKGIARSSRSQSCSGRLARLAALRPCFQKQPAKFLIRTESHRVTRAATGGTDDASRSGCRAAARSSSASHARANRAVAPAVRRCDLDARISIGRDACDLQPLMQRTYYATPHEDRVTARAALQLERKALAGREQMQAVCVSAGSLRRSRRRD